VSEETAWRIAVGVMVLALVVTLVIMTLCAGWQGGRLGWQVSDFGLQLGEVTPEVAAFLESQGHKTDTPHRQLREPAKLIYVSRHVVHDPPAWGPLTRERWPSVIAPARVQALRVELEWDHELGSRTAVAFHSWADKDWYLTRHPQRDTVEPATSFDSPVEGN
jgi:hypothetical protein